MRIDASGDEDLGESIPFRTGEAARMRIRTAGFRLPKDFGEFLLQAEWRRIGDETWHRDSYAWPLTVSAYTETSSSAPNAEP